MTDLRQLTCVSPHVPYDGIDHAGGDYLLEYLRAVSAEHWAVTVICPDTPENRSARIKAPARLEVVLSPRDRMPRALRAFRLLVRGANGMAPRRWMRRLSVDALAAIDAAELLDLHWMGSIQYAHVLRNRRPEVPILATPHDVKSEAIARAGSTAARWWVRIGARLALRRVRRLEGSTLNLCDRIFVFKSQDIELVRAIGVEAQISTTPPLVRLPERAPTPDPSSRTLLFMAAFWRDENDEAARWFLTRVWPRLSSESGLRVRFAGSRPSDWLCSQAGDRVEVTGYLPNPLDAYHGVGLVIAPLRRGAGLKFKVAQAIALGFPVVGTSIALEGMDGLIERDIGDPADSAESFAAAVLATVQGLPRRVHEANKLAAELRERLDFSRLIAAQVRTYADVVTAAVEPVSGSGSLRD